MQITHAKSEAELEQIADLRGKVFTRRSYFEFYDERMRYQTRDPWYKPEHSRIIKENGKIVSHVSIIEKPVRFEPAVVKIGGIGDVFTVPQARGKGCSRMLMADALNYLSRNHFPLSMLYGIPNYYHKFGFIEAIKEYKFFLAVEKIRPLISSHQIRDWQPDDVQPMIRLYQSNCRDTILTVDRNEAYLKRLLTDPKRLVIVCDENGTLTGYAHLVDEISKQFVVNEAMTGNYDVSKTLIKEILRRAPRSCQKIEMRLPPNMPFIRHLQHLGAELQVIINGEGDGNGMLKVINLSELLKNLVPLFNQRLQNSELTTINTRLHLSTEKAQVHFIIENGTVKTIETIKYNEQPQARVNQRYFVRNIVGYWSIDDLLELTEAEIDQEQTYRLLKILFPKEEPFMLPLDYF